MKNVNTFLKILFYSLVAGTFMASISLAVSIPEIGNASTTTGNFPQNESILLDTGVGIGLDQLPEAQPSGVDTSYIEQKWMDIPYANFSDAQKMDIYLPNTGSGPFPVIIFIHGGGFALGDKGGQGLGDALSALNRSYAVASINYRLSGEAKFPAQINDVKAAIKFIRAHADAYNLDPNKIAVWGGSAGGNLAALAGTSGDVPELTNVSFGYDNTSDKVQAVIDWFGPINFLTMDDQFHESGIDGQSHNTSDSMESQMLGKQITLVPNLVTMANPETYISPDDPPFFIEHGTADKNIPLQQSIEFSEKLISIIGIENVTLEILEGAGHGDPLFSTQKNLNKTLDFLDSIFLT